MKWRFWKLGVLLYRLRLTSGGSLSLSPLVLPVLFHSYVVFAKAWRVGYNTQRFVVCRFPRCVSGGTQQVLLLSGRTYMKNFTDLSFHFVAIFDKSQ